VAEDHVFVLEERSRYLRARIQAKESVGWDARYDECERKALEWAIGVLRIFQKEARAQSQAILQGDDLA